MKTSTADLCDDVSHAVDDGGLRVLPGPWGWYGQRRAFNGRVSTVDAAGCNSEIRQALAEPGDGRVLFIDANGNPCACVGGNLALLAYRNGWAGVIVHGNVRDVAELRDIPLGILALGAWPVRSENRQGGRRDVPLRIDKNLISPGDIVCADEDGVIVLPDL